MTREREKYGKCKSLTVFIFFADLFFLNSYDLEDVSVFFKT